MSNITPIHRAILEFLKALQFDGVPRVEAEQTDGAEIYERYYGVPHAFLLAAFHGLAPELCQVRFGVDALTQQELSRPLSQLLGDDLIRSALRESFEPPVVAFKRPLDNGVVRSTIETASDRPWVTTWVVTVTPPGGEPELVSWHLLKPPREVFPLVPPIPEDDSSGETYEAELRFGEVRNGIVVPLKKDELPPAIPVPGEFVQGEPFFTITEFGRTALARAKDLELATTRRAPSEVPTADLAMGVRTERTAKSMGNTEMHQRLAQRMDAIAHELSRARAQEVKPKHLFLHARRAAVQAVSTFLEAMDASVAPHPNFGTVLRTFLHLRPDQKLSANTVSDDELLAIWVMVVTAWVRSQRPSCFKADAGSFDFPEVKTDSKDRVLGKDGKPLKLVTHTNPETGRQGFELIGKAATVADDFDEADTLSHWRARVADWCDACSAISEMIRDHERQLENEADSGTQTSRVDDGQDKSGNDGTRTLLAVDREARLATWCGKPLRINRKAEFTVLDMLHGRLGKIVPYAQLLQAVKPDALHAAIAKITEAPPELTPAVSRIRRALENAGCPWKITSIPQEGYQLTGE